MAPVRRHAALTFQGPYRWDWLLRLQRTRAAHHPLTPSPSPSPPPSPSPSPSPPPSPPLSPPPSPVLSPSPSPAPSPPPLAPASAEATPNASLPLTPLHASSSAAAATASLPVTPPRATNKRTKEDEPLLPGSESGGDRKKMRIGDTSSAAGAEVVWKMVTLEEIRALPPPATRPFYPRTLQRGARSIKEPKPWKCSGCGNVNDLTRHLVFDLPAFRCKACNAEPSEGDADFGFCYSDLAVNAACPIGHVKSQKPGQCIPTILSSCVEITHRFMSILLEQPLSKEGPFVDIYDLILKYEKRCAAKGEAKTNFYTGLSLLTMIEVFRLDGVKQKKPCGLREGTNKESEKLLKVSDYLWVKQNDFAAMSSAIADGYPLLCLFQTGPRLGSLKPGEIYVPPLRDAIGGHASLLVGAHQEGRVKFLYFLSCNTERFCQRSVSKGDGIRGGVGAIITGHFDYDVIQILRFNETRE